MLVECQVRGGSDLIWTGVDEERKSAAEQREMGWQEGGEVSPAHNDPSPRVKCLATGVDKITEEHKHDE